MKNNYKLIAAFLLFSVTSCQYTGNQYASSYGNKKILKEEKNIEVGNKISDVELVLGSASRVSDLKTEGKLYEYEYHDATRSWIYFSPISAFYGLLTTNIFSPLSKNVSAKIKHNYLFVETDKDGIIQKKYFVKDEGYQKLYQRYCSANNSGISSCSDNSINSVIEY